MIIVCSGSDQNRLELLCNNSVCSILEKRRSCNKIHYYIIRIKLDKFLEWINTKAYGEAVVLTSPEIWLYRKKVKMTIKYHCCNFHFFETTYSDIKDKIRSNFII